MIQYKTRHMAALTQFGWHGLYPVSSWVRIGNMYCLIQAILTANESLISGNYCCKWNILYC